MFWRWIAIFGAGNDMFWMGLSCVALDLFFLALGVVWRWAARHILGYQAPIAIFICGDVY